MKTGLVGRTTFSSDRHSPCLEVAANLLTLLPEARAVRKRVLIRMFSGVAFLRSKVSVDSMLRTLSTDHPGISSFEVCQ